MLACLHEDDENELKTSSHNGVILCLLDEELGDRPSSPSTSGNPLSSFTTSTNDNSNQAESPPQSSARIASNSDVLQNAPASVNNTTLLDEKKRMEEAELKRKYDEYEELSKRKFEQIFRKGLLGLVVESLEMDSWFGGNKSNVQGVKIIGSSRAEENTGVAKHNAIVKDENPQGTFAALANNTV